MGCPEPKDRVAPLPAVPWRKPKHRKPLALRKPWIGEMRKQPCHYCGEPSGTLDHKLPKSKGGETSPSNCVPACGPCNQFRGTMPYEEFLVRWKERKRD